MKLEDKIKLWKNEENHAFKGWDFSHINGRWDSEKLTWNYKNIVEKYLKEKDNLLDMGTGGEFLLSLNHNPKITSATEGYIQNFSVEKCLN
ncbi:hypothetical protein [Miniphocaeibacter massiliensis]|uniref:hypothetical protein n=1 Tax=Miniphocaeibacter massiliensis TaxID=2041841 RepID=UPI000C1B8A88|nr:hypothetical protein [Miniphocaeibacter massiliensis]